MAVIASIIYDIAHHAFGLLDAASVLHLAATLLGLSLWWFSTWLPPP
jgi:hypothetical protein